MKRKTLGPRRGQGEVRKLLTILADKECNSFLSFCTALENSRHKRLATLLRDDAVKKDVEGIRADEKGIRADEEVFFSVQTCIRADVEGERVFIIHAGEDKAQFCGATCPGSSRRGSVQQDIFYDVLSIGVGDVIRARIMSAMASESLELVVTVLSQNSLNHKYWPKLELETALRHNKQLFPVWLDDNQDDFQEFNGLVGKYCPTLKSIRGYKVPRSSARSQEEVGKVAKEIVSKLRKRKPPATTKVASRTRRKRMRRKTSSAGSSGSAISEEDVEFDKSNIPTYVSNTIGDNVVPTI
ncbi:positive regulation of MHC class I biosynthetic process [Branchiostoma belcheri]|nr:positive regulation of MHC class I biosynthetic process [Branchiostoma belcheri]